MPSYPVANPLSAIAHTDFPWIAAVPENSDARACVAGYYSCLPASWHFDWLPPSECSGCPNLWDGETGHKAVGKTRYYGTTGAVPTGVSRYDMDNAIDAYYATAALLSWLYYVVVGPVGFGAIFQGRESINTVEQYTFVVGSGSGENLTLTPQAGSGYPWRMRDVESENYVSPGGGWFLYSPTTKLMRKVESFDFGGLESGISFGVTLFDGGIGAAVDEEVKLLAYINAPEAWTYFQPSVTTFCEKREWELTRAQLIAALETSGDYEGWLELTAAGGLSCRIGWPATKDSPWQSTIKVEKRLLGGGWVNATSDYADDDGPDSDTLVLTHTASVSSFKTYILIDPDDDLPAATYDAVRITYWPETGDSIYGTQVSQMHCDWDRRDFTNSIGSANWKEPGCGEDDAGSSWFCAKMREATVLTDNYLPGQCYQNACPFFTLSEPGFPSWEDIGKLWGDSGGVGILQLTPGVSHYSNYRLFRGGDHPSIMYLAGCNLYSQMGLYLSQCLWGGGGAFGYWADDAWHSWYIDADYAGTLAHEEPSLYAYGPQPVTSGLNKVPQIGGHWPIDYATAGNANWYYGDSTDIYKVERAHGAKRLLSYGVGWSGIPDSTALNPFASGAAGEARYQRLALRTVTFRDLDPTVYTPQSFEGGSATFGAFPMGGVDYSLKLQLTAPGGNWPNLSQVSGTVASAAVTGAAGQEVMCLTFLPGTLAFGYAGETAPQQVLVSYCLSGGNVVEAPPWQRPRNPLTPSTRNKMGGQLDKVFPGCTITINGIGGIDAQKLTVIKARAHSGDAFEGNGDSITSHVVTNVVPGFWTATADIDVSDLDMGEEATAGSLTPIIDSITYEFAVGMYETNEYDGPAGDGEDIESVNFQEVRSETDGAAPYAFSEDGTNGRNIVTPTVWKIEDAIAAGTEYTATVKYHFSGGSADDETDTFELLPIQLGSSTTFACCPAIRLSFEPDLTAGSQPTFKRYVSGTLSGSYAMTLESAGSPVYYTDPMTIPSTLTQYKVLYYDGAWFILFHPHHAGTMFEITYTLETAITVGSDDAPEGPGQPDDYETFRLKQDQVWVDVSDDTPTMQALITMAGAGTLDGANVTADYAAVLKPKMLWQEDEEAFFDSLENGWDAPEVNWAVRDVVTPLALTPPTHYLIDRAMGLIYITTDWIEDTAAYGNPCFAVTAWAFDRTNHLDADQLNGLRACAQALTTFRASNFTGDPLELSATETLLCNPESLRAWSHPDSGVAWPYPWYSHNAWPASFGEIELICGRAWSDASTVFIECDGCDSDSRYPFAYGTLNMCEAAITAEAPPAPALALWAPFRVTSYDSDLQLPEYTIGSAGATYSVGVAWGAFPPSVMPRVPFLTFTCEQQLVPITAPGCFHRISSARVASAHIEVKLDDPVFYRRETNNIDYEYLYDETEEIEGDVSLRVAAYAVTIASGVPTFTTISGGDAFSCTGGDWQYVDCTTLVKEIIDYLPSLGSATLVLAITAANTTVGDFNDVASVAEQYLEELTINVEDYDAGGHPGNLRVRCIGQTLTYTGINFRNLQITLNHPDDPPWPHTLALPPLEDA